jgi:hypothetical protein
MAGLLTARKMYSQAEFPLRKGSPMALPSKASGILASNPMRSKHAPFVGALVLIGCVFPAFLGYRVSAPEPSGAAAADQWAVTRDSNVQDQQHVDEYRKGTSPWSLQVDFHDWTVALRLSSRCRTIERGSNPAGTPRMT